jgi:hypothetical protein
MVAEPETSAETRVRPGTLIIWHPFKPIFKNLFYIYLVGVGGINIYMSPVK